MKKNQILIPLLLCLFSCTGQDIPNEEFQLRTATLAAPEHKRAEATIMGFNNSGEVIILKKGSNDFICIADDPKKEGFSVAAYHNSLDPFMVRGRELKKQGLNAKEVFDKREEK